MATPASSPARRRAALGVLAAAGLGLGAGAAVARPTELSGVGHVVLLGDSVFDNKAYVGGEPDVVAHLRGQLPDRWRATLAAVDGTTAGSLLGQLSRVPADATHLVVSIGGNDVLRQEATLGERVRSVGEGLARLAVSRERFRQDYGRLSPLLNRHRISWPCRALGWISGPTCSRCSLKAIIALPPATEPKRGYRKFREFQHGPPIYRFTMSYQKTISAPRFHCSDRSARRDR